MHVHAPNQTAVTLGQVGMQLMLSTFLCKPCTNVLRKKK